ncbi:uncharacterized protein LOC127771307 isoform X2 [Oryza glaberrima]|uniref:uncharacterized protein LOC127771307 isoform X2 n=1 Tax=Oryza glaberrima TaxID=4538 RepID=UPI00224C5532|nr:uncharacterized protein LOC127771307 isoform X2 [Oryza glaberrima]
MEEVEVGLLEGGIGWLAETILENLDADKLDDWIRQVGLADVTKKLRSEIERVEVVVAEVKGRAIGNRSLARSLGRLRELFYDADDAVDELDYYRLQQQVEGGSDACQGAPESVDGHGGGAEQTERAWVNAGEGELASGSAGTRRSGVWQYFEIVEEKNGKPAKAKCVDCHTVVKCGSDNGTSVLHNHRNSGKCKRKRGATGQPPNLPSASEGAVNGNSSTTSNSVGRKRMRTDASTDHVAANSHPWNKTELSNTIQQMTHRLQEAMNEVMRLSGSAGSNQSRQSTPPATNATTSSYLLEPKVYGRDAEMESIKNMIMGNKSNGITILPIVGIGGIGKTTLSQRIYNDPEIGNQFEIKIWVHVSDKFDVVRITREILECVSHQSYQGISNFNMLQQDLEKHMKSKKFLVVLDDVWDVTTEDCWNKLLCPLRDYVNASQEVTGNIIIVTTRIQNVSKRCGTVLEKQIVRELNGNPLAVKTVGRLLSRNLTLGHWNSIIEHKEWQSLRYTDGIMHALKSSYDHLPRHLQKCFSYCSLFPKGYSLSEAQLIQIWIAQGFVEKSCEKLEQKGWEYLAELVNSGFFQQVGSKRSSSKDIVLSDLMHDLARMVSKTECATIDGLECKKLAPNIRHLSIVTGSAYFKDQYGNISRNEEFEKRLLKVTSSSKLRTLVLIGQYDHHFFKSFQDTFKVAHHLRLLQITSTFADFDCFLSSLVSSLNCTHLRYLRVENEESQGALPQDLSECYQLQVLDVGSCGTLDIPNGIISNLVNLRHLVGEVVVLSRNARIGNKTSLQELSDFKVHNSIGIEISQLQSMNQLVQLSLSQLERVTTRVEAYGASLRDKQNLEKLHLSWRDAKDGYDSDMSYENENDRYMSYKNESHSDKSSGPCMDMETRRERPPMGDTNRSPILKPFTDIASEVLDGLEPHHSLKHLRISGYNGATSPTWLPSSLTCLQTLRLEKCGTWQRLPLERLPLLIKLVLIKMRNATEVSIPSLEELVLIELPSLSTCSCSSIRNLNSSLKVLKIKNLPALEVFPLFENCQKFDIERTSWLSHLRKLTIYNCPLLCVHNPLPPSSISRLSIGKVSTLPTMEGSGSGTLIIGLGPDDLIDFFNKNSDQLKILDDKVLSFHNLRLLTGLTIYNFQNLATISLESLRQLVCLKSLKLHNCPEFLSSNVPSELACEYMSATNHNALPSLKRLHIEDCGITGKWLYLMLQHTQALHEVSLHECEQITGLSIGEEENSEQNLMSASEAPSLQYPGRDKLLRLSLNLISSLKKVSIRGCSNLTFYWSNKGLAGFTSLEELDIVVCPELLSSFAHNDGNDEQTNRRWLLPQSLREFQIGYVGSLKTLQPCFPGNLTHLKKLVVWSNESLTSLQLHSCTALQELIIQNCESLDSLEGLQSLGNLKFLRAHNCLSGYGEYGSCILPQSLEELHISEYSQEMLQPCFPDNLTSLKILKVEENQSLTSLQLHSCTALQELIIKRCGSLNSLQGLQLLSNLRLLEAHRCLSGHGEDGRCILPRSLEELYVSDYSQETLQLCFQMNLTCLKNLEVSDTSCLKCLELQSCTALEHLKIKGCASLATLEGLQFLHALKHLEVFRWPSLPPYLESLSRQGYELCPRLERLKIDGPSFLTTSFCKHLTSLHHLELYECVMELGRLTDEQERAFQLLTSLQELRFGFCYNLIDLPAGLHTLPSLKRLEIFFCKSIERLPEKGLPPSLEELDIFFCSDELAQQCKTLASKLKVIINGGYVN